MYKQNAWTKYQKDSKELMAFNADYIDFISKCKTEREVVDFSTKLLESKGFKDNSKVKTLKPGDKVYFTNKNKNLCCYVIGQKPLKDGFRILGAHIDSPRLDVKQNPLYESKGFALLDTHYYGGIKKYQWVTTPLALHGVVCKKDGSIINVNIGEDDNDPIFGITDLLIHLSADQLAKSGAKVVEGENLDVTVGHMAIKEKDKTCIKENILKLLKDKYNIEEEDFVSSEIEVVPAGKARDFGLDKSMVAGYGQDDRVCAYTSLRAIIDMKGIPEYTSCCILVDKEEIGSVGATGMSSIFFENTIVELLEKEGGFKEINLRKALENSKMLSSDVSAGFDPLYAGVNEAKNSAYLGEGICFNKYTGSRGKSGCNDAMPEFIAEVRSKFDGDGIHYQTSELGKVDQGGGGTIAYILGNLNMNVVDAGIAVLSMHSPMEITSKVDNYEAYLAYISFLGLK